MCSRVFTIDYLIAKWHRPFGQPLYKRIAWRSQVPSATLLRVLGAATSERRLRVLNIKDNFSYECVGRNGEFTITMLGRTVSWAI